MLIDSAKSMAARLNLSCLMCCRRSHQMEMCPLWMSFASMKLWTRPSFPSIQDIIKVSTWILDHSHHSRPNFLDLLCRTIHARLLEVLCIFTQSCYLLSIISYTWALGYGGNVSSTYISMLNIYACLCLIHPHSSCVFLPQ